MSGAGPRRALAGGAALLLHVAFVAWLLASMLRVAPPQRRAALQIALAAPPTASAVEPSQPARLLHARDRTSMQARPAAVGSPPLLRSDAAPAPEVASSPGPPSPDAGARASPASDGGQAALRAIAALFACHSGALDALEPAVRARCEATRLAQARAAPQVDGLPPEKRAYYDGVVAKLEEARGLAAAAPHVPPLSRSHALDVTASYRCDIKFGPGTGRANHRAGVRWRVPPCPPHLPHLPLTVLTAEALAPTADTLREREEDARANARFDPAPNPDGEPPPPRA